MPATPTPTRRARRHALTAALAALLLLVLAACGGDDATPDPDGDTDETTEPGDDAAGDDASDDEAGDDEAGDDDTTASDDASDDDGGSDPGDGQAGGVLQLGMLVDSAGFDPALTTEATALAMNGFLFERLVAMTPDAEFVPQLATDWNISDDGLTYTFDIREGVTFHDGTELTAADAAFSIERLRTLDESPRTTLFEPVEAVTADGLTLTIELSEPYGPLLSYLSEPWASIVSQAAVEADGDAHDAPVGTGPFALVDWQRDQQVTFEAYADYWEEGLPLLDGIEVTFNQENSARQAALVSGQLDYLYRLPPELAEGLIGDDSVTVHGQDAGEAWTYIILNTTQEPFDDVRVRQALYHGLDRAMLADLCYPGGATPLGAGFLRRDGAFGVDEDVITHDPDAARDLLAEAGYADGLSIEMLGFADSGFHTCNVEVAQQQLAEIGIDVELRLVDLGQINAARGDGDFTAFALAWGGTVDPDQRFAEVFASDGGNNENGYANPDVDQLIDEARSTVDLDERAALYEEIQRIITMDSGHAFLYNYDLFDITSSSVEGLDWHPSTFAGLRSAWLADQ